MPEGEDLEIDLPTPLRELVDYPEADEPSLLDKLLKTGIDQGCFFRLQEGHALPEVSPAILARFMAALDERPDAPHPEGQQDPFEHDPLGREDPEGQDPGYVVLAQRCDLIKGINVEPLIEVASAIFVTDRAVISAAKSGSSHLVHLCDCEDGAWIVDLRTTGHLPKHWLPEYAARQLLPQGPPRRTFANRIGGRRSRDAVPATVVADFQRPLRDWLYRSAERRGWCEYFSEFMLTKEDPSDGEWLLLGLIGDGKDPDEAADAFENLLKAIREKVPDFPLSASRSDVYLPEDMSVATYFGAFKLDFDKVTYGSRTTGDQALPNR